MDTQDITFTQEQLESVGMAILLTIGDNEYQNRTVHQKEIIKNLKRSLELIKAGLDLLIKRSVKHCPGCGFTLP